MDLLRLPGTHQRECVSVCVCVRVRACTCIYYTSVLVKVFLKFVLKPTFHVDCCRDAKGAGGRISTNCTHLGPGSR